MLVGHVAEVQDAVLPAFVLQEVGHVGRVPAPAADEDQRIALAHRAGQTAVSPEQRQHVFARLERSQVQKIARRQAEVFQSRRHHFPRQRPQIRAHAHVGPCHSVGGKVQRLNDLLTGEVGIGEDVAGAEQAGTEAALESGRAVGGVPFRMQQSRQVVDGDDGRQVARQRKIVRLVINVGPATGADGTKAAFQETAAGAAQQSNHSFFPRRPRWLRFRGKLWSVRALADGEERPAALGQAEGAHEPGGWEVLDRNACQRAQLAHQLNRIMADARRLSRSRQLIDNRTHVVTLLVRHRRLGGRRLRSRGFKTS